MTSPQDTARAYIQKVKALHERFESEESTTDNLEELQVKHLKQLMTLLRRYENNLDPESEETPLEGEARILKAHGFNRPIRAWSKDGTQIV